MVSAQVMQAQLRQIPQTSEHNFRAESSNIAGRVSPAMMQHSL